MPSTPQSPTLIISEIFHSIQGETTLAGWPCFFVRLSGCNLNCDWCDTPQAHSPGQTLTLDEIERRLLTFPSCQLVAITGGEPMMQAGVVALAESLCGRNYRLQLFTNGRYDLSRLPKGVSRIVDIKPPSSGECVDELPALGKLNPRDEVKVCIANREDYDWALETVLKHQLVELLPVSFSPVWGTIDASQLAKWILDDGLPIRLNVQLHKLIWLK